MKEVRLYVADLDKLNINLWESDEHFGVILYIRRQDESCNFSLSFTVLS